MIITANRFNFNNTIKDLHYVNHTAQHLYADKCLYFACSYGKNDPTGYCESPTFQLAE